jgi:hypothetical protein
MNQWVLFIDDSNNLKPVYYIYVFNKIAKQDQFRKN